jgi:predicted nucleic acid-binding protein
VKNLFRGYFRPTKDNFDNLWSECLFSFDSSILIALYESSEETRKKFFDVLAKINDRIWLPHQVASEYFSKRARKIITNQDSIKKLESSLEKANAAYSNVEEYYAELVQAHPELRQIGIITTMAALDDSIRQELEKVITVELADDPILKELADRFDNKVGNPYSENQLEELVVLAEARCQKSIPPGFTDYVPGGQNSFGDVLIWFQLIDKVNESSSPIVFTTKDMKEDWWLTDKSRRRYGPRAELIQEMYDKTGKDFYLYSLSGFMSYASQLFDVAMSDALMDEVEQIDELPVTTSVQSMSSKAFIVNPFYGAQREIARHYQVRRNNADIARKLAEAGVDLRLLATSPTTTQLSAISEAARMLNSTASALEVPYASEILNAAQNAINQAAADTLRTKLYETGSPEEVEGVPGTEEHQALDKLEPDDSETD